MGDEVAAPDHGGGGDGGDQCADAAHHQDLVQPAGERGLSGLRRDLPDGRGERGERVPALPLDDAGGDPAGLAGRQRATQAGHVWEIAQPLERSNS